MEYVEEIVSNIIKNLPNEVEEIVSNIIKNLPNEEELSIEQIQERIKESLKQYSNSAYQMWQKHDFDINKIPFFYRTYSDCSLFLIAAQVGSIKVMEIILQQLPKEKACNYINTQKNEYGNTALHLAAIYGRLNVVEFLIENGANIDAIDEYGYIALHFAAIYDHLNVVEFLTKNGANIDAIDKDGRTALHLATENGHLNVVEFLIENGANVYAIDKDGRTALHLAAEDGHLNVVEFLTKNGANIDAIDKDGRTALHLAAEDGHLNVVEFLTKNGANVDAIDQDEKTALHLAAKSGDLDVVKLLIESGANIDAIDKDGRTALHLAAENGSLNVVEFLTKNGANIDAIDKDGNNALYLACEKDKFLYSFFEDSKFRIATLLVCNGATCNIIKNNRSLQIVLNSVLVHAAEEGDINKITNLTIEKGWNIDAEDKDGNTALDFVLKKLKSEKYPHTISELKEVRRTLEQAGATANREYTPEFRKAMQALFGTLLAEISLVAIAFGVAPLFGVEIMLAAPVMLVSLVLIPVIVSGITYTSSKPSTKVDSVPQLESYIPTESKFL